LARYERDVASTAYVISRRGSVPDKITEGEEVLVPTFEIAVNPQIRLSEIRARRFYIVDRAGIKNWVRKTAICKDILNSYYSEVTYSGNIISKTRQFAGKA